MRTLANTRLLLLGALAVATFGASTALASTGHTSVSSNWAGYTAGAPNLTQISFERVSGTWKQPKVTCGPGDAGAAAATWVGLGGRESGSPGLEQIGTSAECDADAKPAYFAWYELLPAPGVRLALTIRPGDTIAATVQLNPTGTRARLHLADRTRGTSVTKNFSVQTSDSASAEWIVEAPATCDRFACHPLALANFGTVSFTGISLTANGHAGTLRDSHWAATSIKLSPTIGGSFLPGAPYPESGSSGSTAGAVPTTLSKNGTSFAVKWQPDTALPRGALALRAP